MPESKPPSRTVNLECIPYRLVLYFLMLTCIIVSFMMRTVINLAILAMVREYNNSKLNETKVMEELCYTNDNSTPTIIKYGGTLEWSIDVQYYILTSFFWTYTISQVFGGVAVQRLGTKVTTGYALLTASLCNLAVPLASKSHYVLVIIVQSIHGLALGVTWPALFAIISCWAPIQEKSRFVSSFQGLSIGVMLAQLMTGFIIASIGWEYVFYITGSLGLVWLLLWYFFVYDTPELHPHISLREINYIKKNREPRLNTSQRKVPWISMLCSLPMWAIAIVCCGRLWLVGISTVYGPLYFKTVIGLNVQTNGVLSSIISLGSFLSSLIFSYTSDKIGSYNIITTLSNRKLLAGIGTILPALLLISMGYIKCNTFLLLTLWSVAQIMSSALFMGPVVNITDITSNFGGPAMSLVQTLSIAATVCATFVAKSLLNNGITLEAWQEIFNITSGVLISSYVFYFIFSSANMQKWNHENDNKTTNNLSIEEGSVEELSVLNK